MLRLPVLLSGFELSAERIGPPKALPNEVTNRLMTDYTCTSTQRNVWTSSNSHCDMVIMSWYTTLRRTFRAPIAPARVAAMTTARSASCTPWSMIFRRAMAMLMAASLMCSW